MVKKQINQQKGGDGYTINVNQAIGGLPGFSRYSYNYKPVFEGELLQNGGDGYSVDLKDEIGGLPTYTRYTDAEMVQKGAGCGCDGNDVKDKDPLIFSLIKLKGGNKENITQFYAIKELAHLLTPLSTNHLLSLNVNLFLNILNGEKPNKSKQLGGFTSQLQDILAPLGKNNLLVLSSLLLLHYFAIDRKENKVGKKVDVLSGGDSFTSVLTNILTPTGLNTMGASVLLIMLQQAFIFKNTSKNLKTQEGGNPLKNLIAPLGTNAFIATGLLIIIEKLFTSTMNKVKKNNTLVGGKINKKYEDLFNLIAPLTFNTFAKQSFLKNFKESVQKK